MRRLLPVLAIVALAACGGKDVTSGVVVSRDYQPAYDQQGSMCVSYDPKTGMCTMSMVTVDHYNATWTLCLRDDTEDRPPDQQDTGCVTVSEADYNRFQVGDHFPPKEAQP